MAGSRGYHSYRGRTSGGKVVAAVVLVLVILGAVLFMAVQENIIYDWTGTPHLRVPQQEEAETTPSEEDVELTIETPAVQTTLYALSLKAAPLTGEALDTAELSAQSRNAEVVTLKDAAGKVYFDAAAAVRGAVSVEADTADALGRLTEEPDLHAIARLSCFHDPKAANSDVEGKGLKNTGGYIFYDGNNSQWLDPAKPAARQYLCQLAAEAAALGFDEIMLTDVSYPTVGKLNKIAYGDVSLSDQLAAFLTEMRTALEPYSVALSIELPEAVIATGADETAGQVLTALAPLVDRVYAATTADQAETLRQAVTAASSGTEFVPELTEAAEGLEDGCLVFES